MQLLYIGLGQRDCMLQIEYIIHNFLEIHDSSRWQIQEDW